MMQNCNVWWQVSFLGKQDLEGMFVLHRSGSPSVLQPVVRSVQQAVSGVGTNARITGRDPDPCESNRSLLCYVLYCQSLDLALCDANTNCVKTKKDCFRRGQSSHEEPDQRGVWFRMSDNEMSSTNCYSNANEITGSTSQKSLACLQCCKSVGWLHYSCAGRTVAFWISW